MPSKYLVGLAATCVVLALIFGVEMRRSDAANAISLQALHAAQFNTKQALDSTAHLTLLLGAAKARVDTVRLRSNQTVAKADSWAKVADSILHSAAYVRSDTIAACRPVLDALGAKTSECELLRLADAQKDTAIQIGQMALVDARSRLVGLQAVLDTVQAKQSLVAPPYECKVWFVKCPSRTVMFVLGVLGGVAARKL